ncbi:AAA family ATPase [Priestia megaterium]|nr:AAA family ATPase [Priestia megaterium]
MYILIDQSYFEKHIKPVMKENTLIYQTGDRSYSFDGEFKYNITKAGLDELDALYQIAKETDNIKLQRSITPIRNMIGNPDSKPTNLKAFFKGVFEFLKKDLLDGWLYEMDNNNCVLPYLVDSVEFIESIRNTDDYEREYVQITLKANRGTHTRGRGGQLHTKTLKFDSSDIRNKTVEQSLQEWGFIKEDKELKKQYLKDLELFNTYQREYGKQFVINKSSYRDDEYYHRSDTQIPTGTGVNDEETLKRVFTTLNDPSRWRENGITEGFEEVPLHSYVYLFHLQVHRHVWVHVRNMKPYVYDKSLRDKLVLPQTHRDLIDILVEHLNVLLEDIIKGKSGGTTILCKGGPGLGKTLTAEVYAEITEKALYKIQSGQLGLKSDDVERNLQEILDRADRWGAILLIDEADVYIRRRGEDLHHNALVAAILRTLEYFNGLLFMTTNRGDDVDDAILSRCIAIIDYKTPTLEAAEQIWTVLSTEFQTELAPELIKNLVKTFPEASGRDIKELLKLAIRFAIAKDEPLTLETFRQCAQFRGLKIVN